MNINLNKAAFVKHWNGIVFWFDEPTYRVLKKQLRRYLWKRFFWSELLDLFLRFASRLATFLFRRHIRWSAYPDSATIVRRVRETHTGDFKKHYDQIGSHDDSKPMTYPEMIARVGLPKEDRNDKE